MANREEITGAKIVQHRTLAWAETDAAGHNHFSAALRWLEEAEHLLWARLGLADVTLRRRGCTWIWTSGDGSTSATRSS